MGHSPYLERKAFAGIAAAERQKNAPA